VFGLDLHSRLGCQHQSLIASGSSLLARNWRPPASSLSVQRESVQRHLWHELLLPVVLWRNYVWRLGICPLTTDTQYIDYFYSPCLKLACRVAIHLRRVGQSSVILAPVLANGGDNDEALSP